MLVLPPDVDFQKLPIKSWSPVLEDQNFAQAQNLANLPFAFKHISLMPDTHMGYGMPIGGVLATRGYVIPYAVGVDIGCGMCVVRLPIKEVPDQAKLKSIISIIRKDVPMGYKKHKRMQDIGLMPDVLDRSSLHVVSREFVNARNSLGTLGGGNHFAEIQQGSNEHIYLMVHSGSRNLGKQVCEHYNKLAIAINERYFSSVPTSHELAFLPIDSKEGQSYIAEMKYCIEFARLNRKHIMDAIVDIVYSMLNIHHDHDEKIDVAHNYARMEHHFGSDVMVHRKGATSARQGEIGIIPGSQGSMSYIVKGKGNADSFTSCSHGAGRSMGSNEAKRSLNLEEQIADLERKGIVHTVRTKNDLNESVGAYKDIEEVMDNQMDLVSPLVQLRPLACVKG